jgi:type VI secretion system protein ImpJ
MLLPQKLIWAEGVILTQQHFQQWDLYLQQQQNMCATSITPYFWGLREISIDEELLKFGQIVLKKCQVIFPGGLYVHYEENNDLPLSYRIQPSDKIKMEIYLALPLGKAITEIPGYPKTSHLSTWRSDFQMIKDE